MYLNCTSNSAHTTLYIDLYFDICGLCLYVYHCVYIACMLELWSNWWKFQNKMSGIHFLGILLAHTKKTQFCVTWKWERLSRYKFPLLHLYNNIVHCIKLCSQSVFCFQQNECSQIAKFMGPTRGLPGSCRPQMGPMLDPWTLLSGLRIIWGSSN